MGMLNAGTILRVERSDIKIFQETWAHHNLLDEGALRSKGEGVGR